MNILFLFYAPMLPYVGGIQRVTENLAKEMKRRGHNVCYLSSNSDDCDVQYNYPVPHYFLDETLDKESYYATYQRLLNENNIEIVINQEPREDLLDLLAHTPKPVKRITCFHTQPFLTQGKTRLIMKYYREHGYKASVYRLICRAFPNFHSRRMYILEKKMFERTLAVSDRLCLESERYILRMTEYMPAIDVNKLSAVSNANSFPLVDAEQLKKEKIFLWVGRQVNSPKNVPLFIDFWSCFQPKNPEWKAVIIGVGPDQEYNKRYAIRNKVQNIEFLGYVEDIALYYRKASFFMLTSMYEGFPMVLLEAMNNGCIPCAFDSFESLHDVVDNGENGIISPCFDYRLMVSRIEGLISDPNAFNNMRYAAINKTKNFSVEKIVDKWETIFNTL